MSPVESRVLRVVRVALGDDGSLINLDTRSQDVEEWDSVAQVKLFLTLESEFNVSFSPDELTSLDSVRGIVELLAAHGIVDAS